MATGLRFWDRLVLFLAWVVTCGLVYVLGFYVGKGVQERRLEAEERVVRLPITGAPPPEGQRPKSDLTFYDTLAKSSERPAAPPPERTTPPRAEAPPATPPRTTPPATTSPATTPRTTPPPMTPPPTPPPAPRTPPPPSAPPPTLRPSERGPTTASTLPRVATSPHGAWTVQASPTRSREDAEATLRRLRAKGYEASIVEVPREGATWYRIRVGRYASAGQATEVMQRLRDQEGMPHVFVASE